MKKKIKISKRKVEYTLRVSSRAKRMRLAIYCDGDFVVTVPRGTDLDSIERFIIDKSGWVTGKLDHFKSFKDRIFIRAKKNDFLRYKEKALLLAESRIRFFNTLYRFKFNRINIKNQKTRWGSCSKKGNINFNYKISLLPERMADYVIAHELCHLEEFSHSKKFWDFLEKLVPDCRKIRKELKNYRIIWQ